MQAVLPSCRESKVSIGSEPLIFMLPLLAERECGSVWFCTLGTHGCGQLSSSTKSTVLPPMISKRLNREMLFKPWQHHAYMKFWSNLSEISNLGALKAAC